MKPITARAQSVSFGPRTTGRAEVSFSEVKPATGAVIVVGPPGDAFGVFGTVTPEPGSILLLGSGLLGAAGVLRRKLNF